MNFRFPSFLFFAVIASFALTFSTTAHADDLKAEATLSETTAAVNETIELQIKITGAAQASVPRSIEMDGLSINYATHSSQQSTQFSFGGPNAGKRDTSTMTVTYTLAPKREGTFTIPPVTVEVGGKKLTTEAITLKVKAGGGLRKEDAQTESMFAELVPASTQAYVGEAVPMELRIYVDNRIHWQAGELPTIKTDGFMMQKLTNSQPTNTTRNGRAFNLLVFRTAITPVKTGKLPLGSAELKIVAQMPQQKRKVPHLGGGLFDDDFFNDPFGMFAPQQQVTIEAKPVDIDVKPLPPGAPKSFAGAVGRFTFLAEANPRSVHAGDPITLTMKISGRGNFDRIPSPRLSDENGWRAYAPSGKFVADDELGISGTKTFEMAVVPEEKKSELPAVEFCYFDPVTEKYVIQKSEKMAVTVIGEKIAVAATPAPAAQTTMTPPESKQSVTANDILYLRTDSTPWGRSFEPLFRRRTFWLAQTVPLLALIAFVGFNVAQARSRNAEAARLAKLRQEKYAAEKILTRDDADYTAFVEAAAKCLRVEAAITSGKNFHALDVEDVCKARVLNDETVAGIRAIFEACHELRYAGTARGEESLPAHERTKIRETIRTFERARANV